MLFFLPLAAFWLLATRRHRAGDRVRPRHRRSASAPWTIRNIRVYDRFVADRIGRRRDVLDGQSSARASATAISRRIRELKQAELEFRRAHPGLSAEAARAAVLPRRVRLDRRHPVAWLSSMAAQGSSTRIVPVGPSYALHSARYLRRVGDPVPARCCRSAIAAPGGCAPRQQPPASLLWLLAGLRRSSPASFFSRRNDSGFP